MPNIKLINKKPGENKENIYSKKIKKNDGRTITDYFTIKTKGNIYSRDAKKNNSPNITNDFIIKTVDLDKSFNNDLEECEKLAKCEKSKFKDSFVESLLKEDAPENQILNFEINLEKVIKKPYPNIFKKLLENGLNPNYSFKKLTSLMEEDLFYLICEYYKGKNICYKNYYESMLEDLFSNNIKSSYKYNFGNLTILDRSLLHNNHSVFSYIIRYTDVKLDYYIKNDLKKLNYLLIYMIDNSFNVEFEKLMDMGVNVNFELSNEGNIKLDNLLSYSYQSYIKSDNLPSVQKKQQNIISYLLQKDATWEGELLSSLSEFDRNVKLFSINKKILNILYTNFVENLNNNKKEYIEYLKFNIIGELDEEKIKLLLDNGLSREFALGENINILDYALMHSKFSLCDFLLKKNFKFQYYSKIDASTKRIDKIFIELIDKKKVEIFKNLVNNLSDINYELQDLQGRNIGTLLHYACCKKRIDIVKILIELNNIDINKQCVIKYNWTNSLIELNNATPLDLSISGENFFGIRNIKFFNMSNILELNPNFRFNCHPRNDIYKNFINFFKENILNKQKETLTALKMFLQTGFISEIYNQANSERTTNNQFIHEIYNVINLYYENPNSDIKQELLLKIFRIFIEYNVNINVLDSHKKSILEKAFSDYDTFKDYLIINGAEIRNISTSPKDYFPLLKLNNWDDFDLTALKSEPIFICNLIIHHTQKGNFNIVDKMVSFIKEHKVCYNDKLCNSEKYMLSEEFLESHHKFSDSQKKSINSNNFCSSLFAQIESETKFTDIEFKFSSIESKKRPRPDSFEDNLRSSKRQKTIDFGSIR